MNVKPQTGSKFRPSVTALEMDEAFWKKAVGGKPEVAEKLIAHFGEIAQLFMKSCFTVPEGHIIFSEKVYLFDKNRSFRSELKSDVLHVKEDSEELDVQENVEPELEDDTVDQ